MRSSLSPGQLASAARTLTRTNAVRQPVCAPTYVSSRDPDQGAAAAPTMTKLVPRRR